MGKFGVSFFRSFLFRTSFSLLFKTNPWIREANNNRNRKRIPFYIFLFFLFLFILSFFFFLLLGRDPPNPSPYTSSSFHYEQSPKKRGYAPVGNGQRMKVVSFGRGWLGPEDDLNGEFDRSSGLMDSSVERETRLGHGSVIFGWV